MLFKKILPTFFLTMKEKYNRVSCDLYDQLESWATFRTQLQIKYKDNSQSKQKIRTIIADLKTTKEGEFLITANELVIRLDHIINIKTILTYKNP